MRRALAVYRAASLAPVPRPAIFVVAGNAAPFGFRTGVPGWGGFAKPGIWLHETAGWEM